MYDIIKFGFHLLALNIATRLLYALDSVLISNTVCVTCPLTIVTY